MKVQLFASAALMLLSAIPGALSAEVSSFSLASSLHVQTGLGFVSFACSQLQLPRLTCLFCSALPFFFLQHQHLHLKEAVAATAADSEGYEEKSPSAKSFSLRGAVAAASAEDAADEDEELEQYGWGGNWGGYRNRDWSTNPITRKRWGSEWQNGGHGINPRTGKPFGAVANEFCYNIHGRQGCRASSCKWRGNERGCVPRNFEDEEFENQDLEKSDAPEGDEVYPDYDEEDED